jgi:hypothetical protein
VRFGPVAAHIEKGDSGGPVFDSEGRLIGVLSGRDLDSTDDAYFVPIAAGASLLFNVARIQPCCERDIPMATATAETLSRSISDMGERLNSMERGYTGDGVSLTEAVSRIQCVSDKQFQAMSSQIEIIFLNNQIESLKRGDLQEAIGSVLTLYSVQSKMQDARREVERLLDELKDDLWLKGARER